MRIPVVDPRGIPLMPCTPAKARHLFKSGKAKPKRNKLGLFFVQLCYEQEPNNQPVVAGVDPGSKFEGYSVVGTKDTVLNLMAEAPDHVKDAVETRRTMRRARRSRKWRRPKRFDNRLGGKKRIPPSTRSRWEAKARIIAQLVKIFPLTDVVVEDVCAQTRKGKGGKWNGLFSPIQVGKEHLYKLLAKMGLQVHLRRGHQTKELREKYGLKKTKSKSKQDFSSHAVDGWVMAASVSGAKEPTCTRLWYLIGAQLHRRQIHRLQASKGGERKPYGGTRSLGLKRGTIVSHPKYGLCTVGGFDRKKHTISLHAYRTNKRLTQGGCVKDCRVLTWVAFRSWLVAKEQKQSKAKRGHPSQATKKGRPVSTAQAGGIHRSDLMNVLLKVHYPMSFRFPIVSKEEVHSTHSQELFIRGDVYVAIQITANQVISMAPDSSSATAGKKLANTKYWQQIGQNSDALWGECQGSALYQIRIALPSFAIQCSCPSRKLPCKHGLGLLLLAANMPEVVPVSEPPEWITSWLAKRAAASKRKETQESPKETSSPVATATQRKTAEKRLAQVNKGIELLDLWLDDLIRNGLGNLETQSATFWEKQAAQMVDAQVSGLASYIRRLTSIPNASLDWSEKLLAQLGKLALLTQAFHRMEQLEPAMQEDIRQLIGWNLKEDEVLANGERVTDNWLILGQAVEDVERGRAQRTWLLGTTTRRSALLLQFSFAGSPFSVHYPLGNCQKAELAYWPGVQPQRALVVALRGEMEQVPEHLPGVETIEAFLGDVAITLARFPWRDRFLCALCHVIPVYDATNCRWYICDQQGQALPLTKGEHWQLLALSGGAPIDFAGEWDGEALLPLGMLVDHSYHTLLSGDRA